MIVSQTKAVIEKGRQRNRLDSRPIVTGIENVNEKGNSEITDKKRKRTRLFSLPICTGNIDRDEEIFSEIHSEGEINSPDSKKLKNDQSKVMCVIDIMNEELAIVYATEAISKLSIETNNMDTRKLIDCYNPIIDLEMMKKHILEASESWRDKERKYKTAIKFVMNDRLDIKETDIGELAGMLLAAIVNRTPTFCNDCNKWYIVGRENKPKITCSGCNAGMHDCKKYVNDIEKVHGLRWFCSQCNELFVLRMQPQMTKAVLNINIFKGFKDSNTKGNKSIREINKKIKEIRKENEKINDEVIYVENYEEIHQDKEIEEQERKDHDKDKARKKNLDKKDEENKETKKDCWFWSNRKCKYGDRCKYEHPTHCKKMIESGRCPDSRCKQTHPKICRSIYFEGYCNRQNCWYIHPSNMTNRFQNKEQHGYNNQRRNANVNYNNNNNNNSNSNNNQFNNRNWNQNNNNNYNQNNNGNDSYNTNQSFLEQWPTPWEARTQMKMMGNMIEQMAKFMSMRG